MKALYVPLSVHVVALALASACSQAQQESGDEATIDAATSADAPLADATEEGSTKTPPASDGAALDGRLRDGAAPILSDSGIELNDGGCITPRSAAAFCASAGPVCAFSASCGTSSASQCSINCTMATAGACFGTKEAQCLLDAIAANSCTSLRACAWKL